MSNHAGVIMKKNYQWLIVITLVSFIINCEAADNQAKEKNSANKTGTAKKSPKHSSAGHHPTELDQGMVNPGYEEKPKWFKTSFLDLREDLHEATAAKKRLMLYFYQDGCPYCKKLLQDNFSQRDIANKTRATVDTIAINMWGSNEVTGLDGKVTNEKKFARSLNVNFTPTLLFLNEQGQVIMRINGY